MTFLDAIRKGKWVMRKGHPRAVFVKDEGQVNYIPSRADLLADDWFVLERDSADDEREQVDDSSQRFSLLELD